MPAPVTASVFLDPGGRRWRRWRRGLVALGVLTTTVAIVLAVYLLVLPPLLPRLDLGAPGIGETPIRPGFAGTRLERERETFRRRLQYALRTHPVPPARRGRDIAVTRGRSAVAAASARTPAGARKPIVAAFYVSWDDNSLASFTEHAAQLDWVVCEWGFLAPGGDSARVTIDRRVFAAMDTLPIGERPALFLMVSNFDPTTKRFSQASLRAALTDPVRRARVIADLRDAVVQYRLAGVTIDFEDVPGDLAGAELAFTRAMHAALAPVGARLASAVPVSASMDLARLRQLAAADDYVFPMIFDEHYGGGEPGPVASQAFYTQRAREVLSVVPREKVVLMIGAYGYNWNDAAPAGTPESSEAMTFQETMRAAREHHVATRWDSVSMNPYVAWTDPDSVDHVVWFLDAATAHNQVIVGDSLGVAGQAVWRLGDEDRGVWSALRRQPAAELSAVPAGYDVEFTGDGEIIHIAARPSAGRRLVRTAPRSGLVAYDSMVVYPSPYVIDRYGASAHRVALTFDDGPDGRWTGPILDTLRAYHAPATFFVIGENADAHIPLMRRIFRDGHEIGNHTFSHPNLALTPPTRTRLELDANARMIEAAIGRRSAFFRPPYFGDATPTTADELDPVGIATERGYYTIGLRDDAEDWQPIPVDSIIRNVIVGRDSGNVVLLHDGGGDRSRTLAALGPIIDSLRAHGDTLVLVSELAGLTRDQAMPPLAAISQAVRYVDLAGFALLGAAEWTLYWVFMIAVVLGLVRLVVIGALAVAQRLRARRRRGDVTTFAPAVSVIVPAYNEGRVIIGTVASLLGQSYAGDIEIVIVDDGSSDHTLDVAREAFGDEPRVVVLTKPNGGKASALNFGIERASHDVIIGLDADTLFAPDTVAELVQPLVDPHVGAVAGNAKVGNRVNLVTRWQALEYVTSQNFDRRAFALLDGITVVPGAVGAWRRDLVQAVGGFRHDTLAEDQDLTLAVRRAGYSVAYADGAVAYTEAPDTLRTLAKQRFRWSFGTLQCAWKHKDALFRPRYGTLGFIALPNTWLFQLLLPAISPIADLMFLLSLVSVWLDRQAHGATYALQSFEQVMTYYAVFLLVDWLAAVIAFMMESGEEKKLTWLIFLQRFAYRQVMYWVVVRAFKAALVGRVHGWGKLERKATVQLPHIVTEATDVTTSGATLPAFVNPGGGSADAARTALEASGRYRVEDMKPDALGDAIRRAVAGGATRVLVAGGDGTVGAAAAAIIEAGGELAVLPGGTLNHFAKDNGIPEDAAEAARAGADGEARPADVAYVNDRLFLNTSSVGAYVTFVRTRERFEKYVGYRLASLAAAVAIIWRLHPFTVTVEVDGERKEYQTPVLFIGVGERELQLPLLGNRVKDGRSALHVLVPRGRTRGAMFAFALAAAAKGVRRVSRTPHLDSFLVDRCTVSFRRPQGRVAVDGEVVMMTAPLEYRLGRDALMVVRPKA